MKCQRALIQDCESSRLLFGHLDVTVVDGFDDVVGRLAVDCAANGLSGTENLLHSAAQFLGERLVSHGACNFDDLVEGNVSRVGTVLLLLAITGRLCKTVRMVFQAEHLQNLPLRALITSELAAGTMDTCA